MTAGHEIGQNSNLTFWREMDSVIALICEQEHTSNFNSQRAYRMVTLFGGKEGRIKQNGVWVTLGYVKQLTHFSVGHSFIIAMGYAEV